MVIQPSHNASDIMSWQKQGAGARHVSTHRVFALLKQNSVFVAFYLFGVLTVLCARTNRFETTTTTPAVVAQSHRHQSSASRFNLHNHDRLAVLARHQANKLLQGLHADVVADNERLRAIAASGNEEICSKAEWHYDLPYFWMIYKPTWNCAARERVGDIFDGGKWHCNVQAMAKQPDCVVYSLGSSAVVGYESEISQRTACQIHVFDPTNTVEQMTPLLPQGAVFHPVGISGHSGTLDMHGKTYRVEPLELLMRNLGHSRLTVLKMDIEGNEYDAIEALAKSGVLSTSIDELLVEFHWKGTNATMRAFDHILSAGFRIFSHEPNLFYRTMPGAGIEYSFIHQRVAHLYNE